MTVAVIGAGAWGTTVASLLAVRAKTRLWAREPEVVDAIHALNENSLFLPGFRLPLDLSGTNDLDATLAHADVVVVALPSQHLRAIMTVAGPSIPAGAQILSLAKGIELGSCERMTEVLTEVLPGHDADAIGVLSGPNQAHEVIAGQPSATRAASRLPGGPRRSSGCS
jgi:glycerol-3-phosphate dehydrogenase (NAD(P)+)